MKVSDIMSGRVVTIGQKEPVIAAARLLKRMNLGALPVTDDSGRLRGILTDRDIVLRCVASGSDPRTLEVREIMSRGVVTAAPGTEISEASRLIRGDQVRGRGRQAGRHAFPGRHGPTLRYGGCRRSCRYLLQPPPSRAAQKI